MEAIKETVDPKLNQINDKLANFDQKITDVEQSLTQQIQDAIIKLFVDEKRP